MILSGRSSIGRATIVYQGVYCGFESHRPVNLMKK